MNPSRLAMLMTLLSASVGACHGGAGSPSPGASDAHAVGSIATTTFAADAGPDPQELANEREPVLARLPVPGEAFGSGDPAPIRRVLADAEPRIQACGNASGGVLELDLTVTRSGRLLPVRVMSDSGSAVVRTCVLGVLESLHFPAGAGPVRMGYGVKRNRGSRRRP